MPRSAQSVKKVLVTVAGAALTLTGVALLVLPGPGFVLVAAGLAVLATQFAWARRPLNRAQREAWRGVDEVGSSRGRAWFAVACALVLLVVGVLPLAGVRVPYLNALTGAFLVLSGLFLLVVTGWSHSPAGRRARAAHRPRRRARVR
ncbi:PGPGW domain-containing protein [Kineococcus sp. SYSU DK005]|uniref:PGPGW domain-containing protein n=1 Tax=Kineococcus sp. SYSU DK005 TaxID=3383126 RepID=UPI003D7D60E9